MIKVTIGETEYYTNNVSVDYSLCKSKGSASFILNTAIRDEITTFEDIVIKVDGEAIFTGVVEDITDSRFPDSCVITASSELIKAERTWFKEERISSGQLASHWAGVFLGMSKISDYTVSISDKAVYEGHSWRIQTAIESLINIAQIVDARIYPDRHGQIHFQSIKTLGTDLTITLYENKEFLFTNQACRNKVIVFGVDVTAITSGSNAYIPSGETRALAISSSLIHTQGTANGVASKILSTFNKPLQIYSYVIKGEPTLSLNDFVVTPDSSGAITSLKHSIDETGFRTTVTIGELCPNFFGMDIVVDVFPMFASTINNGVWRSDNNGDSWYNISGTALANTTVNALHSDGIIYLWAITNTGIYKTSDKFGTWSSCIIPNIFNVTKGGREYIIPKEDLKMVDIITDYTESTVIVAAYNETIGQSFLIFSADGLNFDRIILL